MVSAAYPFGGFKQSGLGHEVGPHALDEYTEEKFTTSTCPAGWSAYPLVLSAATAS
jgi:acyl-CoA reductase-like NAD-dependent aldehyde dehydrogenase